jgi:hypothetical protein
VRAVLDSEQRVLCLGARTELGAQDERRLRALLAGPLDWERVWEQAHRHEVGPLLARTLLGLEGDAGVPADWLARGRRRLSATLVQNRALRDELLVALAALGQAGVDATPVKGVVLAETLYGSLALRPTADLDVLVRPEAVPAARAALAALGYRHDEAAPFEALHHPYHDPQYYRATPAGEVCLELHHGLWSARYWDRDDGCWDRRVEAQLGGATVRVLSAEDTLVHLAIHRARSPFRLRHLVDVAELLRAREAALDWDLVLGATRRSAARTAMHVSLELAARVLGAPAPAGVIDALGVGPLKRRVLERTCGTRVVFRPAPPEDLEQQPHLALRAFEQDGRGRIARTLAHAVTRKGQKLAFVAGRRPRLSARRA